MKMQNQGFDYIEFTVGELRPHVNMYEDMGFEKIGERTLSGERASKSVLYAQGSLRILLTQPEPSSKSMASEFLKKHGDGICCLALDVEDATAAFQETTGRGARPALEPQVFESPEGRVVRSEIWTPGDFRYVFMERKHSADLLKPALFDEELIASRLKSPSPYGIQKIDHLTNNVGIGELRDWVNWYKKIFEFKVTREFRISTGRTGLYSEVVESPDRKIKVPINEATEPESQVQEFVERFKGTGVQHLALLTEDIMKTVGSYRDRGVHRFLKVPHTYYEVVPTRVEGVTEDLAELENLQLLLDGEGGGYLLQIFTEEVVGPFFFEFIQRKGNEGFGEGNFKALFEAIERDQVRRGVLEA